MAPAGNDDKENCPAQHLSGPRKPWPAKEPAGFTATLPKASTCGRVGSQHEPPRDRRRERRPLQALGPRAAASPAPALSASSSSSLPSAGPGRGKRCWTLADFTVGRRLGKGKFGEVFLAKEKASSFLVALKVVEREQVVHANVMHQLQREIEVHAKLRHPNVVRLYAYFYDKQRVYLVLEYCKGGELFKLLRAEGRFPEPQAARYFASLARAIQYLHSQGIMHRDLKPENLLLDKDGEVKLADFGWCVQPEDSQGRRTTLCGTLDYLPPEMVLEQGYDRSADLWCLGVILFELLTGAPPFEEPGDPRNTLRRIQSAAFDIPDYVSSGAADLIRRLLVKDHEQRPSIGEVLGHPWLTAAGPALEGAASPVDQPSAKKARSDPDSPTAAAAR